MAKATVHMISTASLSIPVEIPDGLDAEQARDAAIDAAYNQAPGGVCAQCSGWGHEWGLELGEWEVDDEPGSVELDTEG